jgi:hypothetical protein
MKRSYRRDSWLNQPSNRFRFADGDDEGGGGGGHDKTSFTKDELTAQVAAAVEAANATNNASFETKRKELLDETKLAKAESARWKDMDFDKVSNMLKVFGESEEANLIAEGKWEEVVSKRIDKQASQWEQDKTVLTNDNVTLTAERDNFKSMYENKLTDIQLRQSAEKAGVIATAIDDIVTRGLNIFQVDSDGNLESRDKSGELMKNSAGLLITPELFIESLKELAPHYWPVGQGSGGDGNTGGKGGASTTVEQQKADAAKRGDMVTFNRLTKQQRDERLKRRG